MPVENSKPGATPSILRVIGKFLRQNKLNTLAIILLTAYLGVGIAGEVYSVYCQRTNTLPVYEQGDMDDRFRPPSQNHLFGTDYKGRDVFWRSMFAIRTALKVGIVASILSSLIGVALGAIAGYCGGSVDDAIVWVYSTFVSIPTLLFILAFALLVTKGFLFPPLANLFADLASVMNTEPSMLAVYLGIGLTGWVGLCRIVRAETLRLRDAAYIQAAQALGYGHCRIIIRHLLPNLSHLVIIYFTTRFAYAIMTEVIVSYLGLGVQMEPSWGTMIADGQERLWQGVWWEVAAASLFMFFLVWPLNLLGDSLRDFFDPRLKR